MTCSLSSLALGGTASSLRSLLSSHGHPKILRRKANPGMISLNMLGSGALDMDTISSRVKPAIKRRRRRHPGEDVHQGRLPHCRNFQQRKRILARGKPSMKTNWMTVKRKRSRSLPRRGHSSIVYSLDWCDCLLGLVCNRRR